MCKTAVEESFETNCKITKQQQNSQKTKEQSNIYSSIQLNQSRVQD